MPKIVPSFSNNLVIVGISKALIILLLISKLSLIFNIKYQNLQQNLILKNSKNKFLYLCMCLKTRIYL